MNREEVLDLVESLGGDEHSWVDYKEDYYIKGNPYLQFEFLKDIQSLANAIHDEEERYLLIGCDEETGVVGVSNDAFDENDEKRHILSFEEDDLQEQVDGSLTPSPKLSLHTYQQDGDDFGVLVVREPDNPPSVSTSQITSSGDTLFEEGEIWVRKASGKKRAEHEDIENIIQNRIRNEREFILEGIRRVVELDPDTVSDIGKLQPKEEAEADITFEVDEEGDYRVSGEVFRREFGTLQEEVDADIAKRKKNPDYTLDLRTLMRYYSELEIPEDEKAVKLLTHSSLSQWLQGIYWISENNETTIEEVFEASPDDNPSIHSLCKNYVVMGEKDKLNKCIKDSRSVTHPRFNTTKYRSLCEQKKRDRVANIISHRSEVEIEGESIDTREQIDSERARELIPKMADKWLSSSDPDSKKDYKYAIRNLELWLGLDVL